MPTPVSALIHAATLVTAGIYLLLRSSWLLEYSPLSLVVIVLVGSITAFFAATSGLVQNDIKRIVAFSTISQLGYTKNFYNLILYFINNFSLITFFFNSSYFYINFMFSLFLFFLIIYNIIKTIKKIEEPMFHMEQKFKFYLPPLSYISSINKFSIRNYYTSIKLQALKG